MLTKLFGAAVQGIDATIVTIEVNSSRGIKFFSSRFTRFCRKRES